MDNHKMRMKGSPSRDAFKQWHKTLFSDLYACDFDFVLVKKNPPRIVAILDYKTPTDSITFAEVLAYNDLAERGIPIYIVVGNEPFETLKIYLYKSGNWKPESPTVNLQFVTETTSRLEYAMWERKLRRSIQ